MIFFVRGLIQRNTSMNENRYDEDVAATGHLTGLAQDQNRSIKVDTETRQNNTRNFQSGTSRKLQDIVNSSTERWLLANDDAELEYYQELIELGYHKEISEEKLQDREHEYHGMLRVGCVRIHQVIVII